MGREPRPHPTAQPTNGEPTRVGYGAKSGARLWRLRDIAKSLPANDGLLALTELVLACCREASNAELCADLLVQYASVKTLKLDGIGAMRVILFAEAKDGLPDSQNLPSI